MRYAIVAGAWLLAWGALTPQGADAGFLLSIDDSLTAAVPLSSTDVGSDGAGQPVEHGQTLSLLDQYLGVLGVPSGAQAPSNSNPLTGSINAPAIAEVGSHDLGQSSLVAKLPLEGMFSLAQLFESAVFRPPRA
jgi:hypothetical protein